MGDLNDLMSQSEKWGLHPHLEGLIHGFCDTLTECGLLQVHTVGYPFTWERGKGTMDWVEERLDRVVAKEGLCDAHIQAHVYNISTTTSDHSALFLDIHSRLDAPRGRPPFRFVNVWLLDRGCREVVESAWDGLAQVGLQDKLIGCGDKFCRWGGDRHHKFGRDIGVIRKELERLRGNRDEDSLHLIKELDGRLMRLLDQENAFWKQRAKQHWLREADSNTRYYHKYASTRRRKNKIAKLRDRDGTWVEGDVMSSIVLEYYNNIFKSNGCMVGEVLDFVQPRVTQEQNDILMRPFEAE
ncbi:PREDICTED: uncharacterized protein LOC109162446 [Ipomoea nil]|uniref:uncharacterized protein LOC109162446 n=1 Tax=Ipomoea nil TaxID=35883 RepID=UPI000901FB39|nr:PREDICTED: uncharacterized protein LOC109162446 [Ipomoea nil]